jgi:hypothetical protein
MAQWAEAKARVGETVVAADLARTSGSSTRSSILAVAPPSASGLWLSWRGASSETQNSAPSTSSWHTGVISTRWHSIAPKGRLVELDGLGAARTAS